MKRLKNLAKKIWSDESAQGATEYILLLVAVVAVLVIFRSKITAALSKQLEVFDGKMNEFSSQ
jgi:Flp pilus assembly pilin Flp